MSNMNLFQHQNPNVIASELVAATQSAIKNATSTERIKIKNNEICMWYNEKIKRKIKQKDNLKKKFKKKIDTETKQQYNEASKELSRAIKQEKEKVLKKRLNTKNQKQAWQCINELLGKEAKEEVMMIRVNEGEMMTDKKQMAEFFNTHFVDSVDNLVRNIPVSTNNRKFITSAQSMNLVAPDEEESPYEQSRDVHK